MELIMEALEKNAKFFPNEVALVEINPAARPAAEMTWREYTLIETSAEGHSAILPFGTAKIIQKNKQTKRRPCFVIG